MNISHFISAGLAGATQTGEPPAMNAKLSEVQDIQAQIAKLQARAALLIMEGREDAIAQIKVAMADYSITAADLGLTLKAPTRPARPKKAPMYKDPDSDKTWTGQGAPPKWMVGKDYADFLIVKPTP